jgi:archaellin
MHVTGISYTAVLIAAIASFVFGGLWYGVFAKRRLGSTGDGTTKSAFSVAQFAIIFIAQLVMAWMLAGILLHVTRGGIPLSARNAIISAVLIWVGFVMTSLSASHALQGTRFSATLIDGGHWLGVLLIQSAILAAMAT